MCFFIRCKGLHAFAIQKGLLTCMSKLSIRWHSACTIHPFCTAGGGSEQVHREFPVCCQIIAGCILSKTKVHLLSKALHCWHRVIVHLVFETRHATGVQTSI